MVEQQNGDIQYYTTAEGKPVINGRLITIAYLLHDVWETGKLENLLNQSLFAMSQIFPFAMWRTHTSGNGSIWNSLIITWSYQKGIALAKQSKPKEYGGALVRSFKLGLYDNVIKEDYSALYPSIMCHFKLFSSADITSLLYNLLMHFNSQSKLFKAMGEDQSLSSDERQMYKTKRTPFKLLNNSLYGLTASPHFLLGDTDLAEAVTMRGRLFLRSMVHFSMSHGFVPLVGSTDGITFSYPNEIKEFQYEGVNGVQAVVNKFNKEILKGALEVDFEKEWQTELILKKNNYINRNVDKVEKDVVHDDA